MSLIKDLDDTIETCEKIVELKHQLSEELNELSTRVMKLTWSTGNCNVMNAIQPRVVSDLKYYRPQLSETHDVRISERLDDATRVAEIVERIRSAVTAVSAELQVEDSD